MHTLETRKRRKADIKQRLAHGPALPGYCRIVGCTEKTPAATGKGLSRRACRRHEDQYGRHGSYTHHTFTGAVIAPHRRAALAWLEAHQLDPAVIRGVLAVEALYAAAGASVKAGNLPGLTPAERARAAWARLRDAKVNPRAVLAAWLAIGATIAADPRADTRTEFMRVQAATHFDSGEESRYTLFDGFHRYEAAVRAGLVTIPAEIVQDRALAYLMAGDSNNHEGVRWTSNDARRHIARGLKNGTYFNTNGNPWPLMALEQKFKRYGVTRRNLTLYLDKLAKDDEEIAEVMVRIREVYNKQNQPDAPPKTKKELAELATEQRCRIAHSYLDRAFTQMETIPVEKRRAILAAYGLAKLPRRNPPSTPHG